ncbi:hypothetical protein DK986_23870 [Salmonella enterica]|nr:hypothetical protein [Salmonella enterica]
MTDAQSLFSHYRQVKNPNPAFTPREGKKPLPFCRKLMAKAEGFTSRFEFPLALSEARLECLKARAVAEEYSDE